MRCTSSKSGSSLFGLEPLVLLPTESDLLTSTRWSLSKMETDGGRLALALQSNTEHCGDHKRDNQPEHPLQLLNHEQYVAVEVVIEPASLAPVSSVCAEQRVSDDRWDSVALVEETFELWNSLTHGTQPGTWHFICMYPGTLHSCVSVNTALCQ